MGRAEISQVGRPVHAPHRPVHEQGKCACDVLLVGSTAMPQLQVLTRFINGFGSTDLPSVLLRCKCGVLCFRGQMPVLSVLVVHGV
jgi:hypothetical protein